MKLLTGHEVAAGGVELRALEHGLGVGLGPHAHVLLAQVSHLGVDGDGLLQVQSSAHGQQGASREEGGRRRTAAAIGLGGWRLTSCSARETFLSLSLWMSARADPASSAAAATRAPFMMGEPETRQGMGEMDR